MSGMQSSKSYHFAVYLAENMHWGHRVLSLHDLVYGTGCILIKQQISNDFNLKEILKTLSMLKNSLKLPIWNRRSLAVKEHAKYNRNVKTNKHIFVINLRRTNLK